VRRMLRTVAAAVAFVAVAPAAAQAATVAVTGDDGNPVAINPAAPPTIRNMDVQATTTVTAADGTRYQTQVIGPDGVPASTASGCLNPAITNSWKNFADYRGNGTYTVVVQSFSNTTCTALARTTNFPYTISAGVAIAQPQNWLLTRQPNELATNEHRFQFNQNPGAITYEVRYARGGVIGPDGAISGPSQEAFVDRATGTVPIRFDTPGDWVMVARAKTDDFFTPWSAPVHVQVKAPFDFQQVVFPDSRGPRYSLKGILREKAAAGTRVRIAIARGRKGGRFKSLGRPKVRRNGTFRLRFTVRRVGRYRLRYTYRGSSLVAGGTIVQGIRIRRRLI
jgi:hypothetical protein